MTMCCPDPSLAQYYNDPEIQPVANQLKYFYYSEWVYLVFLLITQGLLKAIFGLFNVWIAYLVYATLHFC